MTPDQIDWLERFVGVKAAHGTAGSDGPGEGGVAAAAAAFEKKRAAQQVLLMKVRAELDAFKSEFRLAMSQEIGSGKLKGQRLLAETGTQVDEVDLSALDFSGIRLSPGNADLIARGAQLVTNRNEELRAAGIDLGNGREPLFTQAEIQDEFWTPLKRERILPETYIPAAYSETQQMLDQTNELYLNAIQDRKKGGKLTPGTDRAGDILRGAADVMELGGSLIGQFAPGSREFKLATAALSTSAIVLGKGATLHDQVGDRKFGDAASTALDVMGSITCTVLEQCGVDKSTTRIVKSSFASGSAAIAAGKAFARGVAGAEDGLDAMADACASALTAAAEAARSDPGTQEDLKIAAATVPTLFREAALAASLRQKILDEDCVGIVDCLARSLQAALASVQQVREVKATQGRTEAEAAKIREAMKTQTDGIAAGIDLGALAATMAARTALATRRGDHLHAVNLLIEGVGTSLSRVLVASGVPPAHADMIAAYYRSATAAPAILECLMKNPPQVDEALGKLGDGIATACGQSRIRPLQDAGVGLAIGLKALASGLTIGQAYRENRFEDGMAAFFDGMDRQLDTVFQLPALATPAEPASRDDAHTGEAQADGDAGPAADSPAKARQAIASLLADLRRTAGDAFKDDAPARALTQAVSALEADRKQESDEADADEAMRLVREARADLAALSEAQVASADASSIDRLIAKVERDRMVLKLARQIAEGGAGFVAKFVPALGAASAGIKLAAHLFAAGQRAQQLCRWMQLQDDFEAAQSALESSSRNFIRNQRDQLAHDAAQAAFAATALAGEIAKLSGVGAAVGAAIQAASRTGSVLQSVVEKHRSREELEKAWRVTSLSLRDPGNRKLGLEARKVNASLAKYSIVWGAVVLQDPLARNAMRACDLNEASLNDEDASVDKVVAYLESFYTDDAGLYRELESAPAWMPAELSLGLKSWVRLRRQATSRGQLTMPATGALEGWLALYDTRRADGSVAASADEARLAWVDAVARAAKAAGPGGRPAIPVREQDAMVRAVDAQVAHLRALADLVDRLADGLGACVPVPSPRDETPQSREIAAKDVKAMTGALAVLAAQAGKVRSTLRIEVDGWQAQLDLLREPATTTAGTS